MRSIPLFTYSPGGKALGYNFLSGVFKTLDTTSSVESLRLYYGRSSQLPARNSSHGTPSEAV
jgi:hypothetical protein